MVSISLFPGLLIKFLNIVLNLNRVVVDLVSGKITVLDAFSLGLWVGVCSHLLVKIGLGSWSTFLVSFNRSIQFWSLHRRNYRVNCFSLRNTSISTLKSCTLFLLFSLWNIVSFSLFIHFKGVTDSVVLINIVNWRGQQSFVSSHLTRRLWMGIETSANHRDIINTCLFFNPLLTQRFLTSTLTCISPFNFLLSSEFDCSAMRMVSVCLFVLTEW